jgi:hypothetical protein
VPQLPCKPLESIEDDQWVCCATCGHLERRPTASACSKCGAESGPPDPATFKFHLPLNFSVFRCSGCGAPACAGTCESCGAYIDPAEDRSASARARALGPLRARADSLVGSFAVLPDGHIPVTATQLMGVILGSQLHSRIVDLLQANRIIGRLDLANPAVIGSATRQGVIEILDAVERIRDETRRVASFKPPDELAEVPWLLSRVAAHGALLVATCVHAISAGRMSEAQKVGKILTDLMAPPPELNRLNDLVARAPDVLGLADADLDARVSLALGIPGKYTDEFGRIDPIRIFSVAASAAAGSRALALGAGRYFSHLLETPPEELPPEAWKLALCAVPLAEPRYPYANHRVAELVRTLLRQVARRAPDELAATLLLYEERDAGRAFAASTRARRALRMLDTGMISAPVAEIESLVDIYRQFAEGPYRACMQLTLAVSSVGEGKTPPVQPLLLGEIDARLDRWNSEVGDSLRGAVNRQLRNAAAHEDYRVDSETLEVIIGQDRISKQSLAEALDRLIGTIAAIDAAVLCHRIDTKQEIGTQRWIADSDWPCAEIAIRSVAGAYGVELSRVEFTRGEARLVLTEPPPCSPGTAKSLLVGVQPLLPNAAVLAIESGSTVVAIGADAVRAWREAPADETDLAIVELDFDTSVRAGTTSSEELQLADAVTAQIRLILHREAALETPATAKNLRLVERRLSRVERFASRYGADTSAALSNVVTDLRRAMEAARDAADDPSAIADVGAALDRLGDWTHFRPPPGMRWRGIALDSATTDYTFVGAHMIEPQTERRGRVEQVLPDGSALLRLEGGQLVKGAPASFPAGSG